MDRTSSIIAAFSAGKFPSTKQTIQWLDWLEHSPLLQLNDKLSAHTDDPEPVGTLSEEGEVLVKDLRKLVSVYKDVIKSKNGDDVLQNALWELGQTQTDDGTSGEGAEAQDDAIAFRQALSDLVGDVFSHFAGEGHALFADFASFSRGSMADVAEAIEGGARTVKDKLRETEEEVQQGKRDNLGRSKAAQQEAEERDARQKFEHGMDQAKEVGSSAIGVAQDATAKVQEVGQKASDRLDQSLWKICERAQKDDNYRRNVNTVLDIAHKWVARGIDKASKASAAADPESDTSMEDQIAELVQDKSGKLPQALHDLCTLVERFAGGKSLDQLYARASQCAADIREDPDLKKYWDDYEAYVRKCLNEPGYMRSDEATKRSEELKERRKELRDGDSDKARKWKSDVDAFWTEYDEFGEAVKNDGDLEKLRKAHVAVAKDLASVAGEVALAAAGQGKWVWQDIVNAWIPRLFQIVKDIPLPRTEYVDAKAELVLENVDISSLKILPGHVSLSQTTNMEIDAPSKGSSTTDVSTQTHIAFTGVQLKLENVSFYYRDKTSSFLLNPVTGLLDVSLPPRGIDLEVDVSLIPTASGGKEREDRYGFHRINKVTAHLHDLDVKVRESNMPVTITVFGPILRSGVSYALKKILEEQVRVGLEAADSFAYDVHKRALVFDDAGLPGAAAYVGGFISKIGAIRKKQAAENKPGALDGLRVTNVGVIRDDPRDDKAFAVGAGPQILSGDKHGPIGNFAGGPPPVVANVQGKAEQGKQQAQSTLKQVQQKAGEAKEKVVDFQQRVKEKRERELKSEGWRSDAFNLA